MVCSSSRLGTLQEHVVESVIMGMLQSGIRSKKCLSGITQLVDGYVTNWYQRKFCLFFGNGDITNWHEIPGCNIEPAWAIYQSIKVKL